MTDGNPTPNLGRKNARVAVALGGIVAGMVGLSFAAVPLYDLFCRVTGFGGTTQVAESVSGRVVDRMVTVRFNADVNGNLPWQFRPAVTQMQVKVGEAATTTFHAKNVSDKPLVGTATYNVTPDKTGIYFNKVQCFCFTEQRLDPGQSVEMPVYFFVDPAMADDPKLADTNTITLSYTFFLAADQSAAAKPAQPAPAQAAQALDGAKATGYQGASPSPDGAGAGPAARPN